MLKEGDVVEHVINPGLFTVVDYKDDEKGNLVLIVEEMEREPDTDNWKPTGVFDELPASEFTKHG